MPLFRYLTFEGGLATLKHGTLKLTPPSEFNDPFDMFPRWDVPITDEIISEFYLDLGFSQNVGFEDFKTAALSNPKAYRRAAQMEVYKGMNRDSGAVCFSRTHNSIPMWAYYCANQTGLVIEFDERHDQFAQSFGGWLRDVCYVLERPAFTQMETGRNGFDIFYTKAKEWRHEAEVRLIHPLNWQGVSTGEIEGRPAWFLEFPKPALKAIYFGCRMNNKEKSVIAEGLSGWGFNDIRLIEMKPHEEHFAFEEKDYLEPESGVL